jgi:type III secretion system low calcium response chaperone LcrH/SycD
MSGETTSGTESTGELKFDLTPGQERAMEVLAGGGTLKDVRGLSQEDVETVYAIGFNLYNQSKYAQAEPMFQFACLYCHTEPRYWMALGNCRQMSKQYQPAIDAYGFAYALALEDPWPLIQAAICFLALQNKDAAGKALDMADKVIAGGKPSETARLRVAALRHAL